MKNIDFETDSDTPPNEGDINILIGGKNINILRKQQASREIIAVGTSLNLAAERGLEVIEYADLFRELVNSYKKEFVDA